MWQRPRIEEKIKIKDKGPNNLVDLYKTPVVIIRLKCQIIENADISVR